MRRSSTAFSIPSRAGSATPPPPDSDTASTTGSYPPTLERKDSSSSLTKLQTPAQPAVSTPSPIPESPMLQPYLLTPHLLSRKGRPRTSPALPIPTLVVNDPTDDAPSVFTDEPEELSVPDTQPAPASEAAPAPAPASAPSAPASKPSTPSARVSAPHLPCSNPLHHPNSGTLTSTTPRLLHPLLAPQSHLRPVRILLMSGQNTHAPVKPLRLLKVKVHPYRNA